MYIEELGKEIEAPAGWSYNAVRIFADKYLAPKDKNSIPVAIWRVARTVAGGDLELAGMLSRGLTEQRFSFNSPVWFNAGLHDDPQCSACFIQSVDDDMGSILDLATKEGQLFKHGSGTGTNLSTLRGSMEGLTGGGKASGPVSFMKMYDAVAGIVKSGGKTRRAAKMQILDVDHPDIRDFVQCKAREERKAKALITKAGYDASFDGEAYASIFFQNANLSVRVTDDFMEAVENDRPWVLTARTTGEHFDSLLASDLLRMTAESAWECGDPGIQYHDTINEWHTCPQDGPITASNPCSEYMFLPETACNLASLNLVHYLRDDKTFNVPLFIEDIECLVTAMDNIVELAGYPTEKIAEQSRMYRTLGLGYTNLGYALALLEMPYDSEEARDWAASVTALMHFAASRVSANLASERTCYDCYSSEHMDVHCNHMGMLPPNLDSEIWLTAHQQAEEARVLANEYGFRNAQMTVLAPTGTISFAMDCITTGIEPLFSRRMTKTLAGGGTMELEFDDPHIRTADEVSPRNHLLMMAACQPFISGAISKTINMPSDATVEDIVNVYKLGHQLGLKAVAVYRDGCKQSQPLSTKTVTENRQQHSGERHPLPSTREAVTHRFSVDGHTAYLTVGLYEDGSPGEVFINVAKEGSTISGLLDSWAVTMSIALQHGVPLDVILDKLEYQRFEPAGFTGNADIPMAHSLIDYIARWLLLRFCGGNETAYNVAAEKLGAPAGRAIAEAVFAEEKTCPDCGSMMQRTGACYSCSTCGANGGCG